MITLLFPLLLQAAAPSPAPVAKAAPAGFLLEVLPGNKLKLSVPEAGVPLSVIVTELKLKLDVPVTVSRELAAVKIKSAIAAKPLEEALALLAPRAYLDYRATSGPTGKVILTAIAFQSAAEEAPPLPPESFTSLVIEGSTLDPSVETLQPLREAAAAEKITELIPEGPFIRTSYQGGLINVRVHQRTPAAIGSDLAETLGVAFTLHSGFDAGPVDLEITGAPLDDLARWLPPGMSVLYRREVSTRALTPLRLLMGEPPAKAR